MRKMDNENDNAVQSLNLQCETKLQQQYQQALQTALRQQKETLLETKREVQQQACLERKLQADAAMSAHAYYADQYDMMREDLQRQADEHVIAEKAQAEVLRQKRRHLRDTLLAQQRLLRDQLASMRGASFACNFSPV
eukprot:TRINITY_DN1169_c0_g1_i1.p3 TRINITY_DN1169_c0_g1~~TRINITY_DN1169_c0_g1_i1.p3  ORF type:complete len:138 (+),score=67.37 TRINITY_DN1169_c0_g1_i1:518-931(+)